jgi:hypothetical protein
MGLRRQHRLRRVLLTSVVRHSYYALLPLLRCLVLGFLEDLLGVFGFSVLFFFAKYFLC